MADLKLLASILLLCNVIFSQAIAEELNCPGIIDCPRDQDIAEMMGIEDARVDYQDIDFVSYCWDEEIVGFGGGEVVGLTRDCKIVFRGQYKDASPIRHEYFWKNGIKRRVVTYHINGETNSDILFDETGESINLQILNSAPLPENGETTVQAERRDDVNFFTWRKEYVRICGSKPEITYGKDAIEKYLHKNSINIAYIGMGERALSVFTIPIEIPGESKAYFYQFRLQAKNCDESSICKVSVSSWKRTAPIKKGVLVLDSAVNDTDRIATDLVNLASNSIERAVVQCHISRSGDRGIRRMFRFPF